MTKDEALKMAIEALEFIKDGGFYTGEDDCIEACKAALEQPSQEPVAWMHRHAGEITEFNDFQSCQYCEPLYTHPAPSWQGLSGEELENIKDEVKSGWYDFARAIEQALKEKNT